MKRHLALLVGALIMAALAAGSTGGVPASASDPFGGRYTFVDAARSSILSTNLDRTASTYATFAFGVPGTGLFRSNQPATVVVHNDHSVVLHYQGGATLDAGATVDPTFGLFIASGATTPANITFDAQINPDRVTATATLWSGGASYHLVARTPPAQPDATVTSILGALRAQNWASLYGFAYSRLRSSVTQSEFVNRLTAAWAPQGSITAATVTSLAVNVSQAGFSTALASVSLTFTKSGTSTTRPATISLIYEPDGWKLLSIDFGP